MIEKYFYVDIYTCLYYDEKKGFTEKFFQTKRTVGNINLVETLTSMELYRVDALVKKIDEDTYYSEEYNEYYHKKPSSILEKYICNIRPAKLENILSLHIKRWCKSSF